MNEGDLDSEWETVCSALADILRSHSDPSLAAHSFLQTLPEAQVCKKIFPRYSLLQCSYTSLSEPHHEQVRFSSPEGYLWQGRERESMLEEPVLWKGRPQPWRGRRADLQQDSLPEDKVMPAQGGQRISRHHPRRQPRWKTSCKKLHAAYGFLHIACQRGDLGATLMLLSWGVDPMAKNKEGKSALEVATIHGHLDIIKKIIMLEEGLVGDIAELKKLLCVACQADKPEMVEYWLDQLRTACMQQGQAFGPHVFSGARPHPLVIACHEHCYDIAADLINQGVVCIDKEVAAMLGQDIGPLLRTWVEPDNDVTESRNNNNNQQELIANWQHKQLIVFDPLWLQDYQNSNHHVLSTINLSKNSLFSVPESLLWGMENLQRLNLSQNAIQRLPAPKSHRNLSENRLCSLSLYQNALQSVPAEIFMLECLEFLSLAQNAITDLIQPTKESQDEIPRVWRCSSLTHFDLSLNKLSTLPREMEACTSLTMLNLTDNMFAQVPQPWACPLEILNISKNLVIAAPPDLPKFWHRTLRFLNLSHNRLTSIPLPVCQLSALSELDLSHNVLRWFPLPDEWGIRKLQHLNLSHNQLVHREPTPQGNKQDSAIKSPKRKKTSPPTSPTSPTSPTLLGHQCFYTKIRNQAAKSPANIIDANSKSTFYARPPSAASGGDIERWEKIEFPQSFALSLYVLKLSHNALQIVPQSISKMETLYDLDISHNPDLHTLPESLGVLKHLFHLKIDGLHITSPSEINDLDSTQRASSGQVLKILKEKLLDSQPFYNMKLMIMGPSKSGKTTLLDSLASDDSGRLLDMSLHIKEWTLHDPVMEGKSLSLTDKLKKNLLKEKDVQEGPAITFYAWDMKGGDQHENIQQCFITSKTLYLLVWDMSEGIQGAQKLSPLLLNISSRSSDYTVVIVGTHSDLMLNSSTDVVQMRSELAAMLKAGTGFPTVAGIVEVDCRGSRNSGMLELRRVIYETAMGMKIRHKRPLCIEKLVGRKVPRAYFELRMRISQEALVRRKMDPPILPIMTDAELAQLVQLIPNKPLDSPEDLQEAISFLNEIGSIVHFTDHLNGLNDLYFIDPVWLACTLQKVNGLPVDRLKAGKVHVETLRELSRESRIGDDKFDQYIQLLARFEIVVPISHHWFLVPSRLPRDNPCVMLSGLETVSDAQPFSFLRRVYKMPYLPPGFWVRLVSRLIADLQLHDKKAKISPSRIDRRLRRSNSISKSIRRGIKFQQTESIYWREGIFFRHRSGQILVRSAMFPLEKRSPGVDILISSQDGDFAAMGCVVDQIEGLIKDWYPGLSESGLDSDGKPRVQRLVPCPICVGQGSVDLEPVMENLTHSFTVEELVQRSVRGETHLAACANSRDRLIAIDMLIPDMFMKDLSVRHLKDGDFVLSMVPGEALGQGGFGEVYRAKFKGTVVAAKTMLPLNKRRNRSIGSQSEGYGSCTSNESANTNDSGCYNTLCNDMEAAMLMECFQNLRKEVAIMTKLNHPCIVKLVGVYIPQLCFAMDYAPMGDLQSYLFAELAKARPHFVKRRVVLEPVLSRMLTYKITQQVASAVQFLHSKDIIYCDLKTDNILLFSTDEDARVNIKLTDYGISRRYDLLGAMGMAGPPGFCAPEILQGKVFDEKVDWFSYGMFLYHLMTGMSPYYDQNSRLEIQLAVNEGRKPGFSFNQEYSMPPRQAFPALGGLMKECWQDRPSERPHGSIIMHMLCEPSFLALQRAVKVEESGVATAFSVGVDNKDSTLHLVVDSGRGAALKSFRTNQDDSYKSCLQNELQCPVIKTAIATPCGTRLIVGTVGDFVQMYHLPSSIQPHTSLLSEVRVSAQPTSLLYVQQLPCHQNSLLVVGQSSGTVAIFSHETVGNERECDDLRQVTLLHLSKDSLPCTSIVHVPRTHSSARETRKRLQPADHDRQSLSSGAQGAKDTDGSESGSCLSNHRGLIKSNLKRSSMVQKKGCQDGTHERDVGSELWVACGSNIYTISVNDWTIDPNHIQVAAGVDGIVEELVYGHGSMWCFTSSALCVYQYCVKSRQCLSILQCDDQIIKPHSYLPLSEDERQELIQMWEEKGKEQELASASAVSETNSNRDCRQPSVNIADLEQQELLLVDDHFIAACIAAPRRQSRIRRPAAQGHRPRITLQNFQVGKTLEEKPSGVKVSSLLILDNRLWIGRSVGDIIAVNLEEQSRDYGDQGRNSAAADTAFTYGEVMMVLSPGPLVQSQCGRVLGMHPVGPNTVVTCHAGVGTDDSPSHIRDMFVWENWDREKLCRFQGIYADLRKSIHDRHSSSQLQD